MQPLRRRQENFEDFGTVFPLEMMQMCVKNTIFFWPPKAAGAKKHPGVPLLAPCLGVPLLAPAFRKSQFLGVTLLTGGPLLTPLWYQRFSFKFLKLLQHFHVHV